MKKLNDFASISDKDLSEILGGKNWWKGIDAVLSPLQSTPSWVQGNHTSGKYPRYTPGGGSYYPNRF